MRFSEEYRSELISRTEHCAYCPNLCLHACPVSTAEGSDVVSPWGKMSLVRWLALGHTPLEPGAVSVLHACTGCGACRSSCKHDVDVSEALRLGREAAVDAGVLAFAADHVPIPEESAESDVLPGGITGYKLWQAGFRARFEIVAGRRAERWADRHELVFESVGDVRCVREIYPRVGIELSAKVILASARPGAGATDLEGPVAYFEACNIARAECPDSVDADAVRRAARRAAGGPLIELRWRDDTATCCGKGGTWIVRSPEAAKAGARRIVENAVLRGARTLLVGCAGCRAHLDAASGGTDLRVVLLR